MSKYNWFEVRVGQPTFTNLEIELVRLHVIQLQVHQWRSEMYSIVLLKLYRVVFKLMWEREGYRPDISNYVISFVKFKAGFIHFLCVFVISE